jgi:hypothetical protein
MKLEPKLRLRIYFSDGFFRGGEAAMPYAAEIVRRFGAKLHALHVRPAVLNTMSRLLGPS